MTRDVNLRLFIAGAALATIAAVAAGPLLAQPVVQEGDRPANAVGRLFFTPAQRLQLDIARRQRARATLATERTEEVAQPIPQTITYDGVVRRSDGKTTVWVNGRPINDQQPVGGTAIVGRIGADGSVRLQVPQSGRSVDLKPGQRVELLSGTVEEGYQRKPPEPKPEAKPPAKPTANRADATAPVAEAAGAVRAREERQREAVEEAVSRALDERAPARREGGAPAGSAPAANR